MAWAPVSSLILISFLVLPAPCPQSAAKAREEPTQGRGVAVPSQPLTTLYLCLSIQDRHTPNSELTPASLASAGCTPQFLPNHLRRAAANVHRAGGGGICEGDPGEHAQHCAHWAVDGCGEAPVHRQDRGQPPVFFLR